MAKFRVKVSQILTKTITVSGDDIKTPQDAMALASKYDSQVGIDPQEIEAVTFELAEEQESDDRYEPIITSDDVI